MKIAVEGCAHGELDNIYAAIKQAEERGNAKIDLLICCGDFQSSRNADDLACMAIPPKYRRICSFYKYFSGEKKAPVLTIFIGGNHEASNYLQELPYGGWVAPNIYYLGYAGVINIAGIRIGGISGIYKARDYLKGRYEKSPYDENAKRSVYHIRNLEVFRLKQLSGPIDVFLSHDWPSGIYNHGNVKQLLKIKPYFQEDIERNQLGSKPCEELLNLLQPMYWFSAHLHCKFTASVPHENNPPTEFLALDKCLPRRHFLEIVDIPHNEEKKIQIEYDLEWLTILHLTDHLLHVKNSTNYMPGPGGNERYNFTPSEMEKKFVLAKMQNTLKVPKNFRPTALAYQAGTSIGRSKQPEAKLNPQTVEFCDILGTSDPVCLVSEKSGFNLSLDSSFLENTTFIIDSDESDDDNASATDLDAEQELEIQDLRVSQDKKMTPMKLPQPKVVSESSDSSSSISENENNDLISTECNDNEQNIEMASSDSKVDVPTISLPENLTISAVGSPKASPKRTLDESTEAISDKSENNVISSTSDSVNTNCPSVVTSDTPTPKKFKRRNASIYGVAESCDS